MKVELLRLLNFQSVLEIDEVSFYHLVKRGTSQTMPNEKGWLWEK